jgi:hypothetical protein
MPRFSHYQTSASKGVSRDNELYIKKGVSPSEGAFWRRGRQDYFETGGTITFGRGVLLSKSSKHKLNVKSSTEAEVVGASDYLPNIIWLRMFLEAQGHTPASNMLAQDNESAMKLEKNGRASAGQKSRHIDIRLFLHHR